ncbi:MAG: hypothetical protein ACLFSQ_05180 [Candidatus Zixiibacteriota bacterium]
MKIIRIFANLSLGVLIVFLGCSKKDRQEVVDKAHKILENNPIRDFDFGQYSPKRLLKELELSEKQWKDIEKIFDDTKKEIRMQYKKAIQEGENFADRRREISKDMEDKIEKVLDKKQLEKYKNLKTQKQKQLKKKLEEAKKNAKSIAD